MNTITKEWLQQAINNYESVRDELHFGLDDYQGNILAALRIALASLEAEPVGYIDTEYAGLLKSGHIESCSVYAEQGEGGITLYTAPPAPLEIADLHRKAAIHDALCEKYNVESLADFVDWQRNHIAELEAAPPAQVGEGETAVMPEYPGYVMTQRECFHAGKKAGLAELVTTAYKLRDAMDTIRNSGIAIDGEKILAERDALNCPVIPDGWVACSERMPEIGIKVLCFPVNDEPIHATYNGQVWLQDISWSASDEPIDNVISCNVFHWMPLPAAPQQEVNNG